MRMNVSEVLPLDAIHLELSTSFRGFYFFLPRRVSHLLAIPPALPGSILYADERDATLSRFPSM